jgi:hypothetical protein
MYFNDSVKFLQGKDLLSNESFEKLPRATLITQISKDDYSDHLDF